MFQICEKLIAFYKGWQFFSVKSHMGLYYIISGVFVSIFLGSERNKIIGMRLLSQFLGPSGGMFIKETSYVICAEAAKFPTTLYSF